MKTMIINTIILLSLCSSLTYAQLPDRERLDAYKIAFLTKRLNLTPAEAEKFWPVYNEFQNQRMEIQQERAKLMREFNSETTEMSQKELENAGDRLIEMQVTETELAVRFHKNLKSVLPPGKILRLYQSENQYRIVLLNQIRERQSRQQDIRERSDFRPENN